MSASTKLTLIANPKTFAERENNKAYYQQKFFSKGQKEALKEKKRKEEIARNEIAKRQEFSECGGLCGRNLTGKSSKKTEWEYKKESLKISLGKTNVTTEEHEPEIAVVVSEPSNVSTTNIQLLTEVLVDSWEELC